jgi:hypothetical protein
MVISRSRVQKKRQPKSPERGPELLIRALNSGLGVQMKGNRKAVDPRALLVLVKRFQELERVLSDRSIPLFRRGNEGEIVYSPEVTRRYWAVNRFLTRYLAIPGISPDYLYELNPKLRGWRLEWRRTGMREQPFIELGLVLDVVKIASAGRISSLKQCAECRRWLFARFPHQRFCSESCKEHFHRSNETDKKRRREWARKNYWAHKALDLGTKNIK